MTPTKVVLTGRVQIVPLLIYHQVFNREYHVSVFAPYYIAVLNGELLKVFGFKVRVVLRVWMGR